MPRIHHALFAQRGRSAVMVLGFALCGLLAVPAAAITLPATDAGFVTAMGGSAKGDATIAPPAKYNYSAGFELHYATGGLGTPPGTTPLAPMLRKNYFVFDLTAIAAPLATARLKLWTGTLETSDVDEIYALHATTDMPGAVGDAMALAGGVAPADFAAPGVPGSLVDVAKMLYTKLADSPLALGGALITHAMDGSFIEIVISPAGVVHLSSFIGGKVLLSGFVPTIDGLPPATPQQPFGFTGPDIPGGDPKTPELILTVVPEPSAAWLMLLGLAALPWLRRQSTPWATKSAFEPGVAK